ncbi:hypothetical protein E2C01_043780 [Portunus trituberculatus]|uniref:Uncharacterized protein n=1 Tax=Portunus trituberculatus TaxID=210409 RepID=A0A5B7FXA5_PORTR|nr:hypothetical protein [Portunus trituberculatus]
MKNAGVTQCGIQKAAAAAAVVQEGGKNVAATAAQPTLPPPAARRPPPCQSPSHTLPVAGAVCSKKNRSREGVEQKECEELKGCIMCGYTAP